MAKRKASKAKVSQPVKRAKASKVSRDVLSRVDPEHWRDRVARMVFPKVGFLPDDVESVVDGNAMAVADHVLSYPQHYGLHSMRSTKRGEVVMVPDDFVGAVQHAVRAGFSMAVRLHQRELEVIPDAAKIVRGQRDGKLSADAMRRRKKEERIAQAKRMQAEGMTVAEIVAHFQQTEGVGSQSSVYTWLNDGV